MPIDGETPREGKPGGEAAPIGAAPAPSHPPAVVRSPPPGPEIPSDEEIADLGASGRDVYATITKKILSESKAADLGAISAKLTELVSVSKGFNPNAAKHGLFNKALTILRSEREQLLAHTQTVQHRIDAIIGELDQLAARQQERIRDMAELQRENVAYIENLKTSTARAKGWLDTVDAARALPTDKSDPAAAAKASSLQHVSQRLHVAIDDLESAATLARQQATEITMTENNSSAILEEFTKTKTLVIPALQSVLAQYLVGLEQKNAVRADSMLRDTLAEAMKENAAITGDNAVQIASLEQHAMISVQTLGECQTVLEESAAKIRSIEEAGRQQRAKDAAARAEIERRILAAAQH